MKNGENFKYLKRDIRDLFDDTIPTFAWTDWIQPQETA